MERRELNQSLLRSDVGAFRSSGTAQRARFNSRAPSSRYPEEPDGLLALDPQLVCYSWITGIAEVAQVVFVRKRLAWDGRIWLKPLWCGGQEQSALIGLTSLLSRNAPMLPKLNRQRALFVLTKIDEILAWEQRQQAERDTRFVELGRYLCEVRAGQYWRLENLKSFDEFLERRFPESRRKAYYLMSIHEHLPPEAKRKLKEVGWTKGLELAKLARAEGQRFDCATWLHKARSLPKEQFKREVEKELTGKDTEPWEIIYFKLYQSQIPVVEQAIETAALMLGSDKSRAYCLEMICADFLAGANLENRNSAALLQSISRFFKFLPRAQKQTFLEQESQNAS